MHCYINIDTGNAAIPPEYEPCPSIEAAEGYFWSVAEEFVNYGGEPPTASIHIADTPDEIHEYPDFVLSLGPRGGVIRSHC
jgi:hypothetical protein